MAQAQPEDIRANSYVGFETITRQIEHKLLKRGFQFNVIVVGACPSSVSPGLAVPSFKRFLTAVLLGHAGQTGLGKSTLVNTLFASHLVDSKGRFAADEEVRQTTEIHPVSHGKQSSQSRFAERAGRFVNECWLLMGSFTLARFISAVIVENGVRLRLNIVDTPGYGDQVNNDNWLVLPQFACFAPTQPHA